MPEPLTHEELRKKAVQWLTGTQRCSVVLSEIVTYAGEIPDAIGWRGSTGESILVECKTSRSDFYRNADKYSVKAGTGVGTRRFFMAPHGLITAEDLVDPSYGLLSVLHSGTVQITVQSAKFDSKRENEVLMLVSALRRVKTREFLTINTCDCAEAVHA